MSVASFAKIKTIDKDSDSEWALTRLALRLVCTWKGQPSRENGTDQGWLKWKGHRRKRSRLYHSKTTPSTVLGKLMKSKLYHRAD